jgi:hypothetical protein
MTKNGLRTAVVFVFSALALLMLSSSVSASTSLQAAFDYEQNGNTVAFRDFSLGLNLAEFRWEFGDSTFSTEQSPTHTYKYTGNYSVMLIIVDSAGQTSSIVRIVHITSINAEGMPLGTLLMLFLILIGLIGMVGIPKFEGKFVAMVIFFIGIFWFAIDVGGMQMFGLGG